jgi:peptidoglycan/LPS O-acetylase OafA/YrhL
MYLLAFHFFAVGQRSRSKEGMERAWLALVVFAVMHFIHLGFVAMNVHFNAIHVVPAKLAGGALAYAMILIYPFAYRRLQEKRVLHLVYFGYVGLVMVITIVARIRGEFEGAEPSLFHSVGLAAVVLVWLIHRRSVLSGKARIHRTWTSEGGPRLND